MKLKKWHVDENNFVYNSIFDRFILFDDSILWYLKEDSIENFHKVRICLRRLRFTMEVFSVYFKNVSKFNSFYKKISKLQDSTGKVRDLDIIEEYLLKNGLENSEIKDNKEEIKNDIKEVLQKFFNSKSYKNFKILIERGYKKRVK